MAKKVTKPIDVLNVNPSEFQWETFISNIVNGKYILVLGSEIMLSRTEIAECDGDSTKLLFNSVKEDLIDNNHIGRDNRAVNFTELSYNVPDINRCIRNMVNEGLEFKIGEMSPELIALIRTKLFRVVLTTTTDPYIEVLMREVWGDELKVMDINSDFSSSELTSINIIETICLHSLLLPFTMSLERPRHRNLWRLTMMQSKSWPNG